MRIELLGFEGCPGFEPTAQLVRRAAAELGITSDITEVMVRDGDDLEAMGFAGSPTLCIDGRDLEDLPPVGEGSCCRRYGDSHTPAKWLVESALLRALRPANIVFMCVQNSARSQLAEAIARHRAPAGVRVQSAGSEPYMVRPQVPVVLREAGIEPGDLYAKSLDDLDIDAVDAVITLCAEEVCPLFPRPVPRLHWALPDPAKTGSEDDKLQSFRDIRDELLIRIPHLLRYAPPIADNK